MAPRIEPAKPPFPEAIATLMERVTPGGPPLVLFTTIARDERLFERFVGRGFMGKGNLSLRHRELVVDRVTAQSGSEYEWGIHVAFFRDKIGFTDEHIYSIVHGGADDPCWAPEEKLLLRLCDSLHATCDVDDALWQALKQSFSDEALLEILMLVGNYRSVAYVTNALRLPLEDFAARFPPRR